MSSPTHIQNYVEDASSEFKSESTINHRFFRVKCTCGNLHFRLKISCQQTVLANCTNCHSVIAVYDLAIYPAAVKLKGVESFVELDIPEDQKSLFVMYEYSSPEPDVEFDPNDITWCQIFVERNDGRIFKVFDDETA